MPQIWVQKDANLGNNPDGRINHKLNRTLYKTLAIIDLLLC